MCFTFPVITCVRAGVVSTVVPTPQSRLTSPHALTVQFNGSTQSDVLYIVSDANVVHTLDTAHGERASVPPELLVRRANAVRADLSVCVVCVRVRVCECACVHM